MDSANQSFIETLQHGGDEPHLLREIFRTYQVLMTAFAHRTGMPASRFALMRLLAHSASGLGITDLARRLEVNPAAVTRQVQELEQERLVRRRTDAKDGRRSYVSLSAKGQRLFQEIHQLTHEFEQSLVAVLGAQKMQDAALLLSNLRAFLEQAR